MNTKILGLTLTMALTTSTANAAIIDDFNGDVFGPTQAPLTNTAAGLSSAGYSRSVTATTSSANTTVSINAGGSGVYAHSQDANVTGYSQIDFALGGMDIDNGVNAFSVTLASADLNGVFGIIVDGVSVSLNTNPVLIASGLSFPSVAEFLFSDFVGVDFNNVNTVSLFADGSSQPALDITFDQFGTTCSALTASGGAGSTGTTGNCATNPPASVPAPAPFALLGLGLIAFGFGRRKAAE